MKHILSFLLFACLTTAVLLPAEASAQAGSQEAEKQKPKAVYMVGASKVTVWENKKADGTTWKNFQVEKIYKTGEEWKSTNSFSEQELLELKAALDKAISEEAVKVKE